jgi:Na+/H+ antiporter NhaB
VVEPVHAEAYGLHKQDIKDFRSFLRSLLLHSAVRAPCGA